MRKRNADQVLVSRCGVFFNVSTRQLTAKHLSGYEAQQFQQQTQP